MRLDLPADGNPTSATSAIDFSSRTMSRCSPSMPRRAKPGALRRCEASEELPRPPIAAGRGDELGAGLHQVGQHGAVAVLDDRALGDGEHEGFAGLAAAPVTHAGTAVAGVAVRRVVVLEESGDLWIDPEHHVSAVAAVAAVGTTQWLELLPMDGDTTVSPIAAGDVQDHTVHKARHWFSFVLLSKIRVDARLPE